MTRIPKSSKIFSKHRLKAQDGLSIGSFLFNKPGVRHHCSSQGIKLDVNVRKFRGICPLMVKLPATVTVRIPTFLVGDPLKRTFTCQCYWEGVHIPSYMILPQWANINSYNQVVYIYISTEKVCRFAPEKMMSYTPQV